MIKVLNYFNWQATWGGHSKAGSAVQRCHRGLKAFCSFYSTFLKLLAFHSFLQVLVNIRWLLKLQQYSHIQMQRSKWGKEKYAKRFFLRDYYYCFYYYFLILYKGILFSNIFHLLMSHRIELSNMILIPWPTTGKGKWGSHDWPSLVGLGVDSA